jgi:hypothetical protein
MEYNAQVRYAARSGVRTRRERVLRWSVRARIPSSRFALKSTSPTPSRAAHAVGHSLKSERVRSCNLIMLPSPRLPSRQKTRIIHSAAYSITELANGIQLNHAYIMRLKILIVETHICEAHLVFPIEWRTCSGLSTSSRRPRLVLARCASARVPRERGHETAHHPVVLNTRPSHACGVRGGARLGRTESVRIAGDLRSPRRNEFEERGSAEILRGSVPSLGARVSGRGRKKRIAESREETG